MPTNSFDRYSRFRPDALSRTFGVNLFLSDKDRQDESVQFKSKVVYCGEPDSGTYYFDLYKLDFIASTDYMGEHLFSLLWDSISPLYPFTAILDRTGQLNAIVAFGVEQRWEKVKKELRKRYAGMEVEAYISAMDDVILYDQDTMYRMVMDDFFFSHLLQFRYDSVRKGSESSFVISSPLLPHKPPLMYQVIQQIQKHPDEDENILQVCLEGTLLGTKRYKDLFFADHPEYEMLDQEVNGTLSFLYEVAVDSLSINSMEGVVELRCGKTVLQKTRMTAFYLEEESVDAEPMKYINNLKNDGFMIKPENDDL